MTETGSFLDALITALDRAVAHPVDSEADPAAILWPDEARQWEPLIPRVRALKLLLTLGEYAPDQWTGPAYWIRYVVDGALPRPGADGTPIVYLPGHGRSVIRAVEDAPSELKPLAELQYRGVIFAQPSGRDWTLAAFLQASATRGGLGIDVAGDDGTKAALRAAAEPLADESIAHLKRSAPLRGAFFNALLTPDLDRDVLRWLDDPVAFAKGRTEAQLDAFRHLLQERFGVEITVGEIEVARRLGLRETDAWASVWRSYADAPERYPAVEERLRAAKPKVTKAPGLFDAKGSWPQDNEAAEAQLRADLVAVATLDLEAARARLVELDGLNAERRDWVWAQLGKAPLADAVNWLAALAHQTKRDLPEASVAAIVDAYVREGWTADDALVRALAAVEEPADREAVGAAAIAVYRSWVEVGAERLQRAIIDNGDPYEVPPLDDWPAGTAIVFTDGLRFDVGRRLAVRLEGSGINVDVRPRLTALPTITPTAKPAASPAVSRLTGGPGLGPVPAAGGASLSAEVLRREIAAAGFDPIESSSTGDPSRRAWAEQGDIDALGHEHQDRLPALLDSEVHKLELRVRQLLDAGWAPVVVITDHGWLYVPGGLPKAELPLHLAKDAMRKGRAARLEEGAKAEVPTVPWFWEPAVRIAVAPGIRTFVGSPVYEHGGISPQECITPVLVATRLIAPSGPIEAQVHWAGLRARVAVMPAPSGGSVDLRRKAGDAASSLIGESRALDVHGKASLLVEDDSLEGSPAFFVVLGVDGHLVSEQVVIIGGEA